MWKFWKRGPQKLPKRIRNYLSKEFDLRPEELFNLGFTKKRGRFAGRRVTEIKIFSLSQLNLILFEGYQEGSFIYLFPKHKR